MTARANTGSLATEAKSSVDEANGDDEGSGIQLSSAAMSTLEAEHDKELAEHGSDLAQQAGLTQTNDQNETEGTQRKRGWDREQAELAEGKDKKGFVEVSSNKGVKQLMTVEQHKNLSDMDDPDRTEHKVLSDIPEANVRAAGAMVEAQMSQGVSKVANMKSDPKVEDAAMEFEHKIAPPLAEPMDIKQPGNDKLSKPMSIELPPEQEQIAKDHAANQLASGHYEQEALMAGPGMNGNHAVSHHAKPHEANAHHAVSQQAKPHHSEGSKAAQAIEAASNDPRTVQLQEDLKDQGAQVAKSIDDSKQLMMDQGLPAEDADALLQSEMQQTQQNAQNAGQKIEPEIVVSKGARGGAKKNLGALAATHKDMEILMDKHMRHGTLDATPMKKELKNKMEEARKQNDEKQLALLANAANSVDLIDQTNKFEDTHAQLAAQGFDMTTLTTDLSRHYDQLQ